MFKYDSSPIVALATAPGTGAIAVIRLSGEAVIAIAERVFRPIKKGKKLSKMPSHTVHLGHLMRGDKVLDEVLVTIFKAPTSYTGEEVVEVSCHGSRFIQQQIIQLMIDQGCRAAQAGEFTLRAFLNGKMDLSQAEAVADLIASENEATHHIALQQMRGGFSNEIEVLRQELLNFASLVELELDFAEEDVEFAERDQLSDLLTRITKVLKSLIDSFATGNVIKNGIPIVIVGAPNAGKSTLLNALLNEVRAIVSDVAGTTRDTIEDELTIDGIGFRFIDTAGIRATQDTIEQVGIQKAFQKIEQARLVLYLIDATEYVDSPEKLKLEYRKLQEKFPQKSILALLNKWDACDSNQRKALKSAFKEAIAISAKNKTGLNELKQHLLELVHRGKLFSGDTIVTNARHYDSLVNALAAITAVRKGLSEQLSGDLLAIDLREALNYLGDITGQVSNDELLGNIFGNFCIGK